MNYRVRKVDNRRHRIAFTTVAGRCFYDCRDYASALAAAKNEAVSGWPVEIMVEREGGGFKTIEVVEYAR